MRALRRDESDETHLLTSNSDGLNFNISVLGTFPQKELLKNVACSNFPRGPAKEESMKRKAREFLSFVSAKPNFLPAFIPLTWRSDLQ